MNADHSLLSHLALCFSSFLVHGFLPSQFMDIFLTPRLKDSKGKITSSDNYRGIAKANILSKLFEIILLHKIQPCLTTTDHQFGYKSGVGTDSSILVLKEVAKRYQSRSTNVFLAFLDASKAFDRVSFTVLFNILEKRGVPNYIIRLLSFWYSSQEVQAQWGNDFSDMFKVSNGVKQGGILSPYLFNVYIDELSDRLNKINVGCYHGGLKINHIRH